MKERRGVAAAEPEALRALLASAGELRLVVAGSSMKPTILAGDSVVIRPLAGAPRVGDVVVYSRGGRLWCHRVLLPGRSVITKGDARGRPDAPVPKRDIIGRAVALQRGSRILDLHGFSSRMTGLAFNLTAPATVLGRRIARKVGVIEAESARHLPIAGFEVEISGPQALLELVRARRGRPSVGAEFSISLARRGAATSGGRYGLTRSGRHGRFNLTTPSIVALYDMEKASCRAEVMAGTEAGALASVMRLAGILLVTFRGEGLALHASAVKHAGRAYIFAGPSGVGKSTAAMRACEAGARVMADDLVLLRPDPDGKHWLAWGPAGADLSPDAPHPERRGTPVAALIIPARGKELALEPVSPAIWTALAGSFPPEPAGVDHSAALERLAALAQSVPCRRARFANEPGGMAGLFRKLEEHRS